MIDDNLRFTFEDLRVYQKALEYVNFIYEITAEFPKSEEFRIKSQFIRAAYSVALNIAEGSGGSNAEFLYFMRIAKRSIRECVVCTTICKNQNLINEADELKSRTYLNDLSRMLSGLTNSIKSSAKTK